MGNRRLPGGKFLDVGNLLAGDAQIANRPQMITIQIVPFDGHKIQMPVGFPPFWLYFAKKARDGEPAAIEFCKAFQVRIACQDGTMYYESSLPDALPQQQPAEQPPPEPDNHPGAILLPAGAESC